MKPWEIYTVDVGFGPHPAVLVSNSERAARKPQVEVLLCSSQRTRRAALPTEVILDRADGLDWETLCKCDLLVALPREELRERRGEVCPPRRREIVSRIIAAHGWIGL